ncbi:MAG: hypothetical protein AAFX06_31980 [Planctomycetota bacterium]
MSRLTKLSRGSGCQNLATFMNKEPVNSPRFVSLGRRGIDRAVPASPPSVVNELRSWYLPVSG